MSRIYFHSPSAEAEVRGSERAYGCGLINRIFEVALGVSDYDSPENPHVLRYILNPQHYCVREYGKRFAEALSTALFVSMSTPLVWIDGRTIEIFAAQLNTAIIVGSDPLRAYARLHGQCEIHGFIEGRNRGWFAKILQRGLDTGMMREGMGWDTVIKMLNERNDEPVVTSYSVCEQFPNASAAGWKPTTVDEESGEADWDAWYDLPKSKQWEMGMSHLRNNASRTGLEFRPRGWKDFHFGEGWTAFSLLTKAIELSKEPKAA